jgi:hypothetical protein
MSCPSALIGHPEASANGFPLKDCGNDGEGLSFFKRLTLTIFYALGLNVILQGTS